MQKEARLQVKFIYCTPTSRFLGLTFAFQNMQMCKAGDSSELLTEICAHPRLSCQLLSREPRLIHDPLQTVPPSSCSRTIFNAFSSTQSAKFDACLAHIEDGSKSLVVSNSLLVLDTFESFAVQRQVSCLGIHRAQCDDDEALATLALGLFLSLQHPKQSTIRGG